VAEKGRQLGFTGNEYLVFSILEFMSSRPAREYTAEHIQRAQKKQRKKVKKYLQRYEHHRSGGKLPAKLTRDMYIGSM
jgi:hypothetical protein